MQPWIHARNPTQLRAHVDEKQPLWIVDLSRQRILNERNLSCAVSTSRFGLGNKEGSNCTPLGLHRVASLIGADAAPGQRFISRKPSGNPLTQWTDGTGDDILSRILWLDGMIQGLNDRSHERYIYIHGTSQEEKLGTPASHGCIRMANQTLIDWISELNGALPMVWIGTLQNAND